MLEPAADSTDNGRDTGAPARRRGRPPQIDRTRILEAALALGIEAASMKAVAERLGVTDAALYHHYTSREALQNEVADALAQQFELPPASQDWKAWSRTFALSMRSGLLDHPGAASVFSRIGPSTPGALRIVETFVTTLVSCGIDVRTAARAYALLTGYLIATVTREESLTRRGGMERVAPDFAAMVHSAEGHSPLLAEVASTWLTASWDGEFEFGIERILDGLEQQIENSGD